MVDKRTLIEAGILRSRNRTAVQIQRLASSARNNNPHILSVMSSPPTVTAVGTTLPAFGVTAYTYSAHPEVWKLTGGTPVVIGGLRRIRSAIIYTTGGNLGSNNGANGVTWRLEGVVDAVKIAFRVGPTGVPYRFIVDGQYVDLTGTLTVASTGTTNEYIVLDFTSVGGRAVRHIIIEGQLTCATEGAYVGTGETISAPSSTDLLRGIFIGDSLITGTGATAKGDSWASVMMDCLGIKDQWLSGSGGTGWTAPASGAYKFGERLTDWTNYSPDVLFFETPSYNDRTATSGDITSAVSTALQATRVALPDALIFCFGCWPGATGPSTAIIDAETAGYGGFSAARDQKMAFIPISTDPDGPWVYGTGYVGATNGSGNSDIYVGTDQVHPPDAGHAFLGTKSADAVIAKLRSM